MPIFSIIIPVYNSERYVERCAKSIENQTFQDYEVIFVDDGSNDSSKEFCTEISQRDRRFLCLEKAHGGASAARNYGIVHAEGEYVVFVDADDYIKEEMLEELYLTIYTGTHPELCFMSSHYVVSGGECNKNVVFKLDKTYNKEEGVLAKDFLEMVTKKENHMPGSTCLLVCNREFLFQNDLEFADNLAWSEDTDFAFRTLAYANNIKCCEYCGYCYFIENNSSISKQITLKKALGRMDVYFNWSLYFLEKEEAKTRYSSASREKIVQQLLAEYCVFLNTYITLKDREERKYIQDRLISEKWLWKQCSDDRYRDYVKYGVRLGTLLQKVKRKIKRTLGIDKSAA